MHPNGRRKIITDSSRPIPSAEESDVTFDGMRRQFLEAAARASVLAGASWFTKGAEAAGEIPRRRLGQTGEMVSMIGLGGYHLVRPNLAEAESIRIVRAGIDRGINFLDNCWDYNGGQSEVRMGKALRDGYRQRAFLMTKIDGRDKKTATQQIEESLRRLETSHIDLLQFHEVIRVDDPDRIFAAGGAIEAALEARKAGKIRYIGFTGHKSPAIHLKMLATADSHQFRFDTVQMPLNVMDAHYDSFEKNVLPVLVKHDIGVLGMKPMGDHIILESKTAAPVECLHYAMNLPTSVVITGCDSMPILDQAVSAAQSFRPMKRAEIDALLAKTAQAALAGKYEQHEISHTFYGTCQYPQWLG
jgi:predicted aldo/keto reductase-like oxidoreductase